MKSLLKSKVSFLLFLNFFPHLSPEPVNFYFMDVSLLSLVPAVLGLQLCSTPCRPWCTAVNQLFTFSSQASSESGLYFRNPFTPNSSGSEYIFRNQIIPIYPASGDPNHHIILKYFNWNSCGSHSLSSLVRSTYKISFFTLRCLIYIGLNGNIIFTQEWQDQTLNYQEMTI